MQESSQGLKEAVLVRLHRNSDFPAMANTVSLINQFKSAEDTSISQFANAILKDHALTSKILKLLNSVHYTQFGEVTTISRAIILLGFGNIKNLALSLMLFDHLQKNRSNIELLNTIVKSFYSGILAQRISNEMHFVDSEEAFICAHFHSFGKLMIAHAWPEKIEEVMAFSRERGITEDAAALTVLGSSYEDFGMTIAKEWNFPAKIVQSMHKMRSSEVGRNPGELDKLISISTLTSELSGIMSLNVAKEEKDKRIERLIASFKDHYGDKGDTIRGAIASSMQDLVDYSAAVNLDIRSVPFSKQLFGIEDARGTVVSEGEGTAPLDIVAASLDTLDSMIEAVNTDTPENIFTKGIQDVNNSILSGYSLNDIIRVVLETIYRGMQLSGLSNVLFFIKNTKLPVMNVRLGFGNSIEELKQWFNISFGDSTDLFNVAIMKQKDIVVKDIEVPEIRKILPEWYRSKVSSSIFIILLPITINGKPIGMFYVEGEKANFQKITGGQLNYLKILRDQTVMSIKQKQGY
jgi:HD-like signal output (HDOD) protein